MLMNSNGMHAVPARGQFVTSDASSPSPQHPSAEAPPVVVDIGATAKRTVAVGGAVSGGLGALAIYSALTGQVSGGAGATVAAGVIGGVLVLLALVVVVSWRKLTRPRQLVFDQDGIRMNDPSGKPWAVAWHELRAVAISRTVQRKVKVTDVRRILVRLDMFPADPGFRARRPEMEHLWELHRVRNGYRLPFGSSPQFIPLIDEAMRRYRPDVYQGVRDEGFTVGVL
jgi:hypothetical protein